ncbi:MAG: histidine phosphatase family protein [Caldilineaceae bacterium]|nr:histidine phosphatase family protein [Caldilineaceae bacterium]
MPTTPKQDATTVLLCRHGESQWNHAGRIQGQAPDAPGLSSRGREQARLLAERMRSAGVDALVTSDLLRAVETAGFVSRALGLHPVEDSRWREIDLGEWQGLTREEVAERWPETQEAVSRGEDPPRGGGETYAQLTARTLNAIADVAQRHAGQTVCVVTHGGNVRAAIVALPDAPEGVDVRAGYIFNTSVTVLRVTADGARLIAPPDISHLDGLASEINEEADDEPR